MLTTLLLNMSSTLNEFNHAFDLWIIEEQRVLETQSNFKKLFAIIESIQRYSWCI